MANDIPNVPAPTPNEVGTPGGVPGLDLTKEICANVTPNVRGDSRFAPYYLTYGQNFNKARRPACMPHGSRSLPSAMAMPASVHRCTPLSCHP